MYDGIAGPPKPSRDNSNFSVSPVSQASQPKSGSLLHAEKAVSHFSSLSTILLTHLKLIKWEDKQGQKQKFYLMDKIESKWRDIGQLLGLSISQLDDLSTKYQDKPTECCRAVLGWWLDKPPPDYPATWNGLIELLEDCQLSHVVTELKTVLSKASLS